jgi:adhesin/invasin
MPRIQPYIVRVTDASGKPVAKQEVDWTITNISGGFAESLANSSTTTDDNGVAQVVSFEIGQSGLSTTGYLQSTISAAVPNGPSVLFYHTQSATDPNNHSTAFVGATQISPTPDAPPLQGVAGTTGTTPIHVRVDAFSIGVPNVSVRLLQENPSDTATISCATGPGADPGSVLTDANGEALCYPVFGGKGGGSYNVLIGGVTQDTAFLFTNQPIAFRELPALQFQVTAATAGAIQIVSGNGQSVTQGQSAQRLTAKVIDSTGNAAISGQNVTWTVTPSSAATLSNTSTTSDSSGQVSTDVRLSNTAIGNVQIKVALTSNSNISATFNITALSSVTLSNIQKVSGDSQSAQQNTAFSQPLVVQVNSTGGTASNIPVTFSITGPGTLSATTANTDANGRASVNAQAGATAGTITVTATVSNLSPVTFTLTVLQPGPSLTPDSFFNAAGSARGSISPCSLFNIVANGLAPNVQGTVTANSGVGPLLPQLAGDKVTVNGIVAPIASVTNANGRQQITAQLPCDVAPGSSVPVIVTVNGVASTPVNVTVLPVSPGLYEVAMSDGVVRAVAMRPDGSFVSLENPARRGEIIRVFATGLGPTVPAIATNSLPAGVDYLVSGQIIVGVNNAGARLISARAAIDVVGVYEVNFQVPSDAATGNDIAFSVAINASNDTQTRFSNPSKLPIQ